LPRLRIQRIHAHPTIRRASVAAPCRALRRLAVALVAVLSVAAPVLGVAPVDSRFDKSCTTAECHPMPSVPDGAIDHAPFLEQWCDRCHTDHSASGKGLLSAPEPQVCLACHAQVETREGALAHPAGGGDCTQCHDPHRSPVRHLLRNDDLLMGCVGCHAQDLAREREKPHHHSYFDPEKECGSCHYAHANSADHHLRPDVGETCLTCHDMAIQVQGRKLENVGAELRASRVLHKPAVDGQCQACHTPHGSVQPSLLKDDYPAGDYQRYERANYALCWQCHDPALAETASTRTATRFRDGDTNLHFVHVARIGKGRACHLCHTPHAAERSHLLRETMRFGAWNGTFDYRQTPEGGSCATACHRLKQYERSAQ